MNTASQRRVLLGVALATVAGLTLAGCGASPSGGDEKTELRILVGTSATLSLDDWEARVAPYLEEHPNVSIKFETPVGDEQAHVTLARQLAAGDAPDMVGGQTFIQEEPMMETIPDGDWVSETPLYDQIQTDGRQWYVAAGVLAHSLVFYNEDAFEEAGVDGIPQTVDELTEAAEKLKAAGYIPFAVAGSWVTAGQFQKMAGPIIAEEDPDWYTARNAGEVTWTDSAYGEYVEVYHDWIDAGYMRSDAMGLEYDDAIADFTSGQAAMIVEANRVVKPIDAAEPAFTVGVFASPGFTDAPMPLMATGINEYAVLKTSEHKEVAFDLLKYLASDPVPVTLALQQVGAFRPGFTYEMSPLNEKVAEIANASDLVVAGVGDGTGNRTAPPGMTVFLNTQLQSMWDGASAADVNRQVDEWWTANAAQ